MTKVEFLSILRDRLSSLPEEDIQRSVDYYNEIIEDQIEDGVEENAAVEGIGSVDEIVSQILPDRPLPEPIREPRQPRQARRVGEIILMVMGSPVWLPLLLAAAIVIFAVYVVLWALIATLYAVVLSFGAGTIAGIWNFAVLMFTGYPAQAGLFLGAGLVCGGFTVLSFFGSNQVLKGTVFLSKKFFLWLKSCFTRKGGAQ